MTQLTAHLVQCWSSCRPISPHFSRVSPLHPEGLRCGYSGPPCPSWWPFSRQHPLVKSFLRCTEAREAYAKWWIRMLSYNLESSDLPSPLGAKAHSTQSMAASKAFLVCNAAGWSTPLTLVFCEPLLALLFSCHSCALPH